MNKILLSIVTPTLNNEKDIKFFINTVKRQNFPKSKIEIILSDGGSKDKTLLIGKKEGARVVKNPYVFADPGVDVGIKAARGEIIMVLACDNIYKDKNAFKKIVAVFENSKIMAAFPKQSSTKSDSIYTKYINTFTDPFNHFVNGYASNGRTFGKIYKTIKKNNIYDVYDFNTNEDKPMIAIAQGFALRKGFTKSRKSSFDDILPVIELINSDKQIAFIHSINLYHHTVRNLKHFAKKQLWASLNAFEKKNYGIAHRQLYLSKSQKFKIKMWPIYSLSFVFPLVMSMFYLLKDREPLWILHAYLCMISALSSVWAFLLYSFNNKYEIKR